MILYRNKWCIITFLEYIRLLVFPFLTLLKSLTIAKPFAEQAAVCVCVCVCVCACVCACMCVCGAGEIEQ